VKDQIDACEKEHSSWIMCGFPRTKVQALAL
jgi:adenylate kinase